MSYSENLDLHPVDINKIEKKKILLKTLRDLTFHHHENCMEYKKILDSFSIDLSLIKTLLIILFCLQEYLKNIPYQASIKRI